MLGMYMKGINIYVYIVAKNVPPYWSPLPRVPYLVLAPSFSPHPRPKCRRPTWDLGYQVPVNRHPRSRASCAAGTIRLSSLVHRGESRALVVFGSRICCRSGSRDSLPVKEVGVVKRVGRNRNRNLNLKKK